MKRSGKSYAKRVADVNRIYDTYARTGLSNREIWRRYVYPRYAISERTFYSLLKAAQNPRLQIRPEERQLYLFPELLAEDEQLKPGFFRPTR